MKCPKCDSEILDDSQFCSKCGTPIHPGDKAFLSHTHTILRPIDEWVPGTELAEKYKIIDVVGKGGMGIVYKAEDTKLKRNVALKFLPPELTKDKEAKERFVIEAQAAAALSHPNICTIHEINEEEGKSFIAMEYVEGQSLKNKIDTGLIAIDEAVDIAIQVAQGLDEAHSKGIIHRDIKSANVMLTEKGQAKIMDFGLAKVKGGTLLTREGTTLGTVAYMSPEQARGEEVNQRTDIWSLGIVLYEMLSGQLPFMGDREASILYSVVHEEAKPVTAWNPDIPYELQQIIDSALKKKPESRYQSSTELLKDLQKYKDSLKAEELGAFSFRSLLRKIKKPIVAIPALLIIAAIAIAFVWYINRQSKIRWARNLAIPEIAQLVNQGYVNAPEAYKLAIKAEKYIPKEAKLKELLSQCSVNISIKTSPSEAKVYVKAYASPQDDWTFIGTSPIEKYRTPATFLRLKAEKDGYETSIISSSTFARSSVSGISPKDIEINLAKKGTVPAGMISIHGTERLDDFFIDKYEVTNRQFKEFIDAGGYHNQDYWKYEFLKDGKVLSWDDAMALFVDSSGRPGPSTWQGSTYPSVQEDYPVSGISWYEAAAYAEFVGKSIPTINHWNHARGDISRAVMTYLVISLSNFGSDGPAAVGKNPGITANGVYDMAGNVREWCWNETPKGRCIRGGAWNDNVYMFSNVSQLSPFDRSDKNGFRCAQYLDKEKISPEVFQLYDVERDYRDYYAEKPVSDSIFQVYKGQFLYDPLDLNARIELREESAEAWIKEKITLDAAYDGERMAAFLYLPKNARPPYQSVIFFPGSSAIRESSSEELENKPGFKQFLSHIPVNRRAVVYPIYKGTFERGDLGKSMPTTDTHQYVEYQIKLIKDLRRVIDYLETRQDFATGKIAYYGMSWGGRMANIIPAVEERLKVNIVVVGGLPRSTKRPEVDDINYVTRVKTPTLMLNGRYDLTFPYETSVKPMFELLGTPDEHKELKLYETDHFIPKNELIKETLAWLDKYLGPVK